jgi:large subunit ribosomal protein L30
MAQRFVVIRIRGSVNVNRNIAATLDMLGLKRVNNAVLIDDRPSYRGMLQKAKDYVTWGSVDTSDVSLILKNRGEVVGGQKVTDEYVKSNSKFKSIDDFAGAFVDFGAELSEIKGLKTTFRLHPPRKGHDGIKRAFTVGGSLGNRGAKIKALIHKMR